MRIGRVVSSEQPLRQGLVVVTRDLATRRDLVFNAWTALQHRRQWFAGPGWTEIERHVDLRVGGGELAHGAFPDGTETIYRSRFHLIEPDDRLVYDFDMHVAGAHFSVSLATVEFADVEEGTRIVYTEHGVFLVGDYDETGRTAGTEGLLDQFSAYVDTL